jgi:cbb3-type cytochrome oxidase subunit 3
VTVRFGGILVAPVILALAMLLAPSASADTYTDQVVGRFGAQTHVVADPAATPPLQHPDSLNQQILTSRWTWSSAPPVWVAAVAPGQTGVTTPDAIHNVMVGRSPRFSGVILVIDSQGYHVRAYNVPKVIADNVDDIMGQSRNDHRNDPYGATSEFVSRLAGVGVASGASTTTPAVEHAKHTSWTWLWVLLIIVGFLGLIWFAVRRNGKRRKDAEAREQIKQELIAAESDVADLDNAVVTDTGTDVSAESLKANSSLYEARRAYQTGDYNAARAHLRNVRSTVLKANRKLNPGQPIPDVDAVMSVPDDDRKQATVRTKNPDTGEYVTINNNNYSTAQQPGYQHYYPGGYHNGMFFYPGYYPYAFWGPGWGWGLTDVLLMDALLEDHWGGGWAGGWDGGYERGFEAGRDSALSDTSFDGGQSGGYDSQQADVGFGGGYDSGGGGFDFGGFGGSDSGGGDFGFGGSDFGGGGFDSGDGNVGF